MSFTLEVHFEYLCAFAPPKPFEETPGPQETWVALRDLRKEEDEDRRHFPILLYDREDRFSDHEVEAEDKTPHAWDDRKGHRRMINLDRVTIGVRPNGEEVLTPNLVPLDQLEHLFRIKSAPEPGLEVFDHNRLTEIPGDLAARMNLRIGTLAVDPGKTTGTFGLRRKGSVGDPIHTQRIARRVVWKVPIEDYVDFTFLEFDADSTSETVLRLRSQSILSATVKVRIRNCEKKWRWKTSLPKYDQSDSEINLYFPMSANYDENNPPATWVLQRQDSSSGICAPKCFSSCG